MRARLWQAVSLDKMGYMQQERDEQRHAEFVRRRYPDWYGKFALPVTLALMRCDWPRVEQLMEGARAAVADVDDPPALELVLATQEFFHGLYRFGADAAYKLWPALREQLAAPLDGHAGETIRHRQQLIHHGFADCLGWEPLPVERCHRLLGGIAPAERNQYLMHEMAVYAFKHDDQDLLELAFSELTQISDGLLGDWFYLHSQLLWHLSQGRLLRRDVDALVRIMQFPVQASDLERTVLYKLRGEGLLGADAQEHISGLLAPCAVRFNHGAESGGGDGAGQ